MDEPGCKLLKRDVMSSYQRTLDAVTLRRFKNISTKTEVANRGTSSESRVQVILLKGFDRSQGTGSEVKGKLRFNEEGKFLSAEFAKMRGERWTEEIGTYPVLLTRLNLFAPV